MPAGELRRAGLQISAVGQSPEQNRGARPVETAPGKGTTPARGDWRGSSSVQLRGVELNPRPDQVRTGQL